mgnify:FL=1
MQRRASGLLAAGLTIAILLSGCGSSDNPDESADGPTTITVSVWNYEKTPEFKALFTAFQAKNPDIKIEPVDILADVYSDKLTTMLAGGDSTDVLTMKNVTDYARYGLRGQLQDLSSLVKEIKSEPISGLDAFDLDGRYFAVPYRQDFWLLYYNKDLFDAAGISYPGALTWTEYVALSKRLTKDVAGKKVYGTYQHTWRSVVQAVAAAQTGGKLLSGNYDFMKSQYEIALDLQRSGATLDWSTAWSQKVSYRTMFETGATAMLPMGTWYAAGILQAKADGSSKVNWGMAPMPQPTAGGKTTTFGSPTAFAVNKKAKHPAAAKRFITWATGAEGASSIAAIGITPALQNDAVTAAFLAVKGMPTDDGSKRASRPDTVMQEMPVSEHTSDIDRILTEEHQLIMSGEKKIPDGIASMGSRVKRDVLD